MPRWLPLTIALTLLAACAAPSPAAPQIQVQKAWARPTIAGTLGDLTPTPAMAGMTGSQATSAAYFVIVNDGSATDALVGATADVAADVEIHQTQMVGDVAQMAPVPRVDVPAHGRIEFKPGGYHVMLMGLSHDLMQGETLKLTLQFEKSGAVTLDVPIQPAAPQ